MPDNRNVPTIRATVRLLPIPVPSGTGRGAGRGQPPIDADWEPIHDGPEYDPIWIWRAGRAGWIVVKHIVTMAALFGFITPLFYEMYVNATRGTNQVSVFVAGTIAILSTAALTWIRGGLAVDIPIVLTVLLDLFHFRKWDEHLKGWRPYNAADFPPIRMPAILIVAQGCSMIWYYLMPDWGHVNLIIPVVLLVFWLATVLSGRPFLDWHKFAWKVVFPLFILLVLALLIHGAVSAVSAEVHKQTAQDSTARAKSDSVAAAQHAAQVRSTAQYDSIVHRVGPMQPSSYIADDAITGTVDVRDPDGKDFFMVLEPHDKVVVTPDMDKEWYWVAERDMTQPEYSAKVNACGTGYTPSTMADVTQRSMYPDQAARMGALVIEVGGDKYGFVCRPGTVQSDTITNNGGKTTFVKVQINTNQTLGGRSGNALFTLQRLKAVY